MSENCAPLEEVQFICDEVTTAQLALTVVPRNSDLNVIADRARVGVLVAALGELEPVSVALDVNAPLENVDTATPSVPTHWPSAAPTGGGATATGPPKSIVWQADRVKHCRQG